MKAHTTGFKNAVKELGRQLRAVITYGNVTLEEEIYAVTPHFEGGILKSIMKQLDLELSVDIPVETVLNCQIGILVNGNYEMLNFGNYVVYKSEKQEDTNTYKLTCYDKMLYSMKQNEELGVPYPISIKNYLNAVANKLGLSVATTTFQNESRMIQNELYLGLEYTYRDILDEIAQATGSIICLNENDEIILKYPTQTNDTIDEEFLKDVNVDFGQMYGAINTIVLSRSGESDNIYYPSELPENPIEIKIKDNQIMNWNDRSDYLPGIYNALNGLYYYINDFSSTGIMYYEVGDLYNVQVGNNTYQCLMLNDEINITTGIEEIIHTDLPEESETDYTKADKTDRRINQTYLIVDKQNQQIESLITQETEQNQRIARVTQTVDELNSKISDIADITTSLESNSARLEFEGINQSEPIRVVIHPIGVNISKLYPSTTLKPSTNLTIKTRILRFTNTTTNETFDYELPDDLLYYDSENYDEFILDYDGLSCIVNKKCKWNADGTVGLLANERTDEYTFPHIELTDGDYLVQLIQYSNGYIFARLMAQNIYTTQFATKAELNSEISQTVDNINLSVNERLTNYSTTSQMNSAIDLKASEITSSVSNTYATKSELSSSTSSLNSKIDQTAQSISLTVDSVQEQVETAQSTANSAQSTANSATTKANNAQTSANNAQATADSINTNLTTNYYTKTQTNSAINQKADSITSTVSQTYSTKTETTAAKNAAINSANASTDTKLQSYSTTTQMNTAIEQKANQITSTVSQTYSTKTETSNAIDNIKIGGTNLLRFTQSGENWTKTSFDAQELTFTRATTATGEAYITHPRTYLTLEKNTQYTLSAWIKSNGYVKSVDFFCYDKNTDHPQSKLNISVNTNWQFVSWTFTTNNYSNSDYSQTTIRFDNNGSTSQGTNAILYVKKPKLEIGNKATDWQPSSEDYSTTTEMNSVITQKANEISARIDQIEDVTNEANGTKTMTLTNCVKGSILELHIYGNNSVFEAMYPTNTLYPQNNLYPKGDSLITVKYANNTTKTYELRITEVLRKNGSVYDEYVLESGQAKIIRRINSDGTVKTTPTTQNLGEFSIALEEGTNIITIKNYSADMYVKYAIKSAYTDIFATQVQMSSSITQTAEEINLEVSKKVDSNEVISKINQSAEAVGINANKINLSANDVLNLLAGNTINLSSKNIEIKADDILINNHGMSFTYNGNKVGDFVTEEITGDSSKRGVSMNIDSNAYFLGLGKYDNNNESQQILAFYNRPTSSHDNAIQIGNPNWNTFVTIHEDAYVYGYLSAANLINRSLETLKKDIEKSNFNATKEVMNTDIYSYRLKEEKENQKKHFGVIIGDNYKCSDKILNEDKDGVELYSMTSILWKAFQEQQEEIEKLRKGINNG